MLELLIAIGFNLLVAAHAALLIYFYKTRRREAAALVDAVPRWNSSVTGSRISLGARR